MKIYFENSNFKINVKSFQFLFLQIFIHFLSIPSFPVLWLNSMRKYPSKAMTVKKYLMTFFMMVDNKVYSQLRTTIMKVMINPFLIIKMANETHVMIISKNQTRKLMRTLKFGFISLTSYGCTFRP